MRLRLAFGLLILTGLLAAQKGPVRVQLTPENPTASLASSLTVQLTAHKIFLTDLGKQITGPALAATWTSSNLAVAWVNNSGLVTGKTSGSAIVTAVSGPFQSSTSVTVDCRHSNGLGQTYDDCSNPLGTPGNASSYNQTMANEAAASWILGTISPRTCGSSNTVEDLLGMCAEWAYSGPLAGHVHVGGSCSCPTNTSPTWQ